MTKFRPSVLWIALGLFGLLVLVVAIFVRVGFGYYLQSESFRQRIAGAVGRVLKADGTFMPLQLVNGTLYSDGFVARGQSGAFFSDLRADQIRAARAGT